MTPRFLVSLLAASALVACSQPAPDTPRTEEPTQTGADRPFEKVALPAFFDCLRESETTILSAHRGGFAAGVPENTLAGMERSVALGPVLLEVDIRETADGVLALFHDDELDRKSNGTGAFADALWNDVQALELKDRDGDLTRHRIPSLSEALAWTDGRAILQLDIKRDVDYETVVSAVRDADALDRVIFITYSLSGAARLNSLAPEAMLSVSIGSNRDIRVLANRLSSLNVALAWTGTEAPNPELYALLRDRNIEVIFGSLGGRNSIDARAEEGDSDAIYEDLLESGITVLATDKPDLADRVIDATGREERTRACLARAREA